MLRGVNHAHRAPYYRDGVYLDLSAGHLASRQLVSAIEAIDGSHPRSSGPTVIIGLCR